MVDYARTRVGTEGVERASDAGTVIAAQSAATQAQIAAIREGFARAGAGIASGIEKVGQQFDPEAKMRRELASQGLALDKRRVDLAERRQSFDESQFNSVDEAARRALERRRIAAANTQLDQQTASQQLAASTSPMTAANIANEAMGRTMSPDEVLRPALAKLGHDMDNLSDLQRERLLGFHAQQAGTEYLVRPENKDAQAILGGLADPNIHGYTKEEAIQKLIGEYDLNLAQFLARDPVFQGEHMKAHQDKERIRDLKASGNWAAAGAYELTHDQRTRQMVEAVAPYVTAGNAPWTMVTADAEGNTKTSLENPLDWVLSHGQVTPEDVRRLTTPMRTAAPHWRVGRDGSYDPRGLANLDDVGKAIVQSAAANGPGAELLAMGRYQQAKDILGRIKNASVDRSDPKGSVLLKAVKSLSERIGDDRAAALIATQLGGFYVDPMAIGKESGEIAKADLREARLRLSEFAGTKAFQNIVGDGRDYDTALRDGLDEAIAPMLSTTFAPDHVAPLGALQNLPEADIAEALNMIGEVARKRPQWQLARGELERLGVNPRLASKLTNENLVELEHHVEMMKAAEPDFAYWKPADQQAAVIAAARGFLRRLAANNGVTINDGRTKADDISMAQERIAQDAELKRGEVELELDGRTVLLRNGRVVSYKEEATQSWRQYDEDQVQTRGAMEALALAQKVYKSKAAETPTRSDPLSKATQAAKITMSGTGSEFVDEFLRKSSGNEGKSNYQRLTEQLDQAANDPARTAEMAGLLNKALGGLAYTHRKSALEVQREFSQAASKTKDPLLEAIAVFLEMRHSPVKFLASELEDIDLPLDQVDDMAAEEVRAVREAAAKGQAPMSGNDTPSAAAARLAKVHERVNELQTVGDEMEQFRVAHRQANANLVDRMRKGWEKTFNAGADNVGTRFMFDNLLKAPLDFMADTAAGIRRLVK